MRILILLLAIGSVTAETRIVIPMATTHIGADYYVESGQRKDFNEANYGLGIEYKQGEIVYSGVYLANNSYDNPSVYASVSRELAATDKIYLSYGIALTTGYDLLISSGIVFTPVFSLTFENIRLVTTYPSSALFHPSDMEPADFVNIQYIHKF